MSIPEYITGPVGSRLDPFSSSLTLVAIREPNKPESCPIPHQLSSECRKLFWSSAPRATLACPSSQRLCEQDEKCWPLCAMRTARRRCSSTLRMCLAPKRPSQQWQRMSHLRTEFKAWSTKSSPGSCQRSSTCTRQSACCIGTSLCTLSVRPTSTSQYRSTSWQIIVS